MLSEEDKKFRREDEKRELQEYLMKEVLRYKIFKEKDRGELASKVQDAILNGWQPLSRLIINKNLDSSENDYNYILPVVIYREDRLLDVNRQKVLNYEIIEYDVYEQADIEIFQERIEVSISNTWQPFGDLIILNAPNKKKRKYIYIQAVVHYDMKE